MEAQQYELASTLRSRSVPSRTSSSRPRPTGSSRSRRKRPEVTDEDIAEVVSMWTGIPVRRLAEEETQKLLKMKRRCTTA